MVRYDEETLREIFDEDLQKTPERRATRRSFQKSLPGGKQLAKLQKSIANRLQYKYAVNMDKISFEWDKKKNKRNQKDHGVSFEEAQSVFFDDDNAIQFWDEAHSEQEDRFLMLGMSYKMRILLVVHCYLEQDSTIRIISARKVTRYESQEYGGIL